MDRRSRLRKHYFWIRGRFPAVRWGPGPKELPGLTQCGKSHGGVPVQNMGCLFGLRAVQKLRKIQEGPEELEPELLALIAGASPVWRVHFLRRVGRRTEGRRE